MGQLWYQLRKNWTQNSSTRYSMWRGFLIGWFLKVDIYWFTCNTHQCISHIWRLFEWESKCQDKWGSTTHLCYLDQFSFLIMLCWDCTVFWLVDSINWWGPDPTAILHQPGGSSTPMCCPWGVCGTGRNQSCDREIYSFKAVGE